MPKSVFFNEYANVLCPRLCCMTYVTGFGKINHFVTFDTSNIYGQNNALHSTSQPYSEYRVSVYTELPENF